MAFAGPRPRPETRDARRETDGNVLFIYQGVRDMFTYDGLLQPIHAKVKTTASKAAPHNSS